VRHRERHDICTLMDEESTCEGHDEDERLPAGAELEGPKQNSKSLAAGGRTDVQTRWQYRALPGPQRMPIRLGVNYACAVQTGDSSLGDRVDQPSAAILRCLPGVRDQSLRL
jgi:hypothetical protein